MTDHMSWWINYLKPSTVLQGDESLTGPRTTDKLGCDDSACHVSHPDSSPIDMSWYVMTADLASWSWLVMATPRGHDYCQPGQTGALEVTFEVHGPSTDGQELGVS